MRRNKQAGFSLIELLIVVAIILIIAAIALPKLLSARTAAQQSAAIANTRSLNTALTAYDLRWGVFPASLTPLGGTCSPTVPATAGLSCLFDTSMITAMSGTVGGYTYKFIQTGSGAGFTMNVDPAVGSAATRHLYSDDGLSIHYNDTAVAAITDPTL